MFLLTFLCVYQGLRNHRGQRPFFVNHLKHGRRISGHVFFGNTWRRWELDQLIREEDVRVDAWPAGRSGLRYLLRTMFCEDWQALYLFCHEEDDVVRSVLWQATSGSDGTWYQALPICGEVGRRLLRELRRSPARRRRQYGAVSGVVYCVWQGQQATVALESPHEWEVRLFRSPERPRRLPYMLVFRGHASAGVASGA
jgi:hypothetical protein